MENVQSNPTNIRSELSEKCVYLEAYFSLACRESRQRDCIIRGQILPQGVQRHTLAISKLRGIIQFIIIGEGSAKLIDFKRLLIHKSR